MEIIILGLLAIAGFNFFRLSTLAGEEAVRAFVFLESLKKGLSVQDTNTVTDAVLNDLASDLASRAVAMAREEYRQVHNGKQIAMIGFAYRNGMRSKMPSWYTAFARSVSPTKEIEFHYESLQPDLAPKHMQQKTRMVTDDQYKSFCKIFCDEVNRICGQSYFEHEDSDVLDDNTLYEAYRQGDDPLVAAAMYCHENGLNHETFASYESYRAAFANEFERLVSNPSVATSKLSAVDDTKVHASFLAGTHPRLAAAGYHEIVN